MFSVGLVKELIAIDVRDGSPTLAIVLPWEPSRGLGSRIWDMDRDQRVSRVFEDVCVWEEGNDEIASTSA